MLTLISCNREENVLVGPSVTSNEAEKIAKENFNIIKINRVELRHLSDEELEENPYEEAKDKTPVYFLIKGIDKKQEEITIFINSNEKRINYTNH